MSDIATSTSSSMAPRRKFRLGATAIGLLAVGGAVGALANGAVRPAIAMAPVHATAIKSLAEGSGIVTIKGRVAERYGNQFVIEDATGKALIDAGRAGENESLAPKGSIVSVQGQFDNGALRPSFLVEPSGAVIALGPIGPGGHGPHDHGAPNFGPDQDRGPDATRHSRGPEAALPNAAAPADTPAPR
jgi:hypothetical protein